MIINEASRQKFIQIFKEYSSYSIVQFVKEAIKYLIYIPKIIQTDNRFEFIHIKYTKKYI